MKNHKLCYLDDFVKCAADEESHRAGMERETNRGRVGQVGVNTVTLFIKFILDINTV